MFHIANNPILKTWKYKNKYPSKFSQRIDNQDIKNMEIIVSEKCINEMSIKDKCKIEYINGYRSFVYPKGEYLSNCENGFMTDEIYGTINHDNILKFESVYMSYVKATNSW